ncbi:tail protein [Shigella phage Buco]|uniref:Putative tail protein n=1 Tax=Shigella phage Buco TaxID=2530183 RepID=A0A482JKT9_9CAUD|nr:tail protein [Shigella phage Buco]QBP32939.1 putative tail protein [Shigella phage Buco]8ES4_C Chain C, Gp39 [Shigella phage Buco]8ES4_D Chain D, Gp39 [Shigella phage Buco]
MRLTDAVNVTLEALGESRIVDINTSNPSAGLARAALDRTRRGVLSTGWWFNTIIREVTPTPNPGQIKVPWNQLSMYGLDGTKYGERDGVLYNLVDQTKVFSDTVHLKVVIDIDFEDLPEHMAMWVANATAAQVYLNDLGADGNYKSLLGIAAEYEAMNMREHLRNQRYSTSRTHAARKIRSGFFR